MKSAIVLLTIIFFGCASAVRQIPKDERINSGLNISAAIVNEGSPWKPTKDLMDLLRVNVINDGNYKIKTDVICSRNGYYKKATVVVGPYAIREVYFSFSRDDFHPDINCRLENVQFLEWYPMM